jgi:hypothetical protein
LCDEARPHLIACLATAVRRQAHEGNADVATASRRAAIPDARTPPHSPRRRHHSIANNDDGDDDDDGDGRMTPKRRRLIAEMHSGRAATPNVAALSVTPRKRTSVSDADNNNNNNAVKRVRLAVDALDERSSTMASTSNDVLATLRSVAEPRATSSAELRAHAASIDVLLRVAMPLALQSRHASPSARAAASAAITLFGRFATDLLDTKIVRHTPLCVVLFYYMLINTANRLARSGMMRLVRRYD